jgi:hypothetical protein
MAKMGCAKCGGAKMNKGGVKPKMAAGGVRLNQKGAGFAKATTGGSNVSMNIFGMPNAGMTGPNRHSVTETMKKGGRVLSKKAMGGATTNRAVMESCKKGLVRDWNGKCVNERKG